MNFFSSGFRRKKAEILRKIGEEHINFFEKGIDFLLETYIIKREDF